MLLPSFLTWQAGWRNDWVNNSGITQEVFDDAVSAFITEVVLLSPCSSLIAIHTDSREAQ